MKAVITVTGRDTCRIIAKSVQNVPTTELIYLI